jgi:hypothetical protein
MPSPLEIFQDYGNSVSLDPDMVFIQVPKSVVPPGVPTFQLEITGTNHFGFQLTKASEEFLEVKAKFEQLYFGELASLASMSPREELKSPIPKIVSKDWADDEESEDEKPSYKKIVTSAPSKERLDAIEAMHIVEALEKSVITAIADEETGFVDNGKRDDFHGLEFQCENDFCGHRYFYVSKRKQEEFANKKPTPWPLPRICEKCRQKRYDERNAHTNRVKKAGELLVV